MLPIQIKITDQSEYSLKNFILILIDIKLCLLRTQQLTLWWNYMINGIGVDIVEVERFQHSISRFGDRLIKKLFTHNDIQYCNVQVNPAMYFASFFAAKEAFSKALATGTSGLFRWKDVEVLFLSNGKSELQFYNSIAHQLKLNHTQLSLSISELHVVAFVIIQSDGTPK